MVREHAAPESLERLLALGRELGPRAEAARRELDALDRTLEALFAQRAAAPAVPPAPAPTGPGAGARRAAIAHALAGRSREEAERLLRAQHGVADAKALLDDVYGVAD